MRRLARCLAPAGVALAVAATSARAGAADPTPAEASLHHREGPQSAGPRGGGGRRTLFAGLVAASFLLIAGAAGANDKRRRTGAPPSLRP